MVLLELKKIPESCDVCAIHCALKDWNDRGKKRHKLCPIVTEHGRIIDADKFLDACRSYAITDNDRNFCEKLEYALNKSDVIIPRRCE